MFNAFTMVRRGTEEENTRAYNESVTEREMKKQSKNHFLSDLFVQKELKSL